MPAAMPELEQQRAELIRQIAQLGDFRSGSITSITGRCGKANCQCHKPNHPGHGPNFRLTRKVGGKTLSETFSSPALLRKAEREVAAYHQFREFSRALLEVNEKICRLRPIAEDATPEEKKRRKRSSKKSSGR